MKDLTPGIVAAGISWRSAFISLMGLGMGIPLPISEHRLKTVLMCGGLYLIPLGIGAALFAVRAMRVSGQRKILVPALAGLVLHLVLIAGLLVIHVEPWPD